MRKKKNDLNTYYSLPTTHSEGGFTLIEILIAITLLIIIGYSTYLVISSSLEVISRNQWRLEAVSVAEAEIETIRNMGFEDVGIEGGFPVGKLQAQKTASVRGLEFDVKTTVRNIDDPFDGTAGGNPNDTAPADYKLVELEIDCTNCPTRFEPIFMTTTVAPKNLETTTNNGSLFVNVFDANGMPVLEADILIENLTVSPTITISDETDANGILQLVDIPTSTQTYEITVGKNGYSSGQTNKPGELSNPNPTKPHSTVASQEVTSISFAIDKVSTINFTASDEVCVGVQGVSFLAQGLKLIGTAPDVYKYSSTSNTNANGEVTLNNIEWDTYTINDTSAGYDLAGSNLFSPLIINPDSTINLRWLVKPANPSALRVVVQDGSSNLINDASVRLQGASTDITLFSGRESFSQTDWSGGQYDSQSGGIETANPIGQISLIASSTKYSTSTTSWLISQTFDLGTSTTNFGNISWNPTTQPAETGTNSFRLQIASNNDNNTWTYIGPDGTANSYYTVSDSAIHASHDNNRYIRYKVYLQTTNENFTPTLEDVDFEFSSGCVPSGQVLFNGLSNGTYTLTVDKPGYQTFTDPAASISSDWQSNSVTLIP